MKNDKKDHPEFFIMKDKKIEIIEDGKVVSTHIHNPAKCVDEVPAPDCVLSLYDCFKEIKEETLKNRITSSKESAERLASIASGFNLKLKIVDGRATKLKPVRKQPYTKHKPLGFTVSTAIKISPVKAHERITQSLKNLTPMKADKQEEDMEEECDVNEKWDVVF